MKNKTYYLIGSQKEQVVSRLSAVLQERQEIAFFYLFGSFIEDCPIHDIDVGVYLSDTGELSEFQYALDLSNILSTMLHLSVEVTVLNRAPSAFLYHVIKGRLILGRDEDFRSRVVQDTVKRYLDHKLLFLRSIKEAFAA